MKLRKLIMTAAITGVLLSTGFVANGAVSGMTVTASAATLDSRINVNQYNRVLYVDSNSTTSYRDVDDALRAAGVNDLIVLGKGTYELNSTALNKKINMVGQGKETELVFNAGFMRNSLNGTFCFYNFNQDASFDKMCISTKGDDSYSNYMPVDNCSLTFNNVVFKDLYTDGFSVFTPSTEQSSINFNNCTFTKSYDKLFRNDLGFEKSININQTYINPTFNTDYSEMTYNMKKSITFTGTPALDSNYRITKGSLNSKVGVYTGKYSW